MLRLGLNPCLGALLLILVALIPTARSANAAQAEKPIQGGLGMEFSQPIADEHLGAETARVPGVDTDEPGVAGDALPWRQFLGAVLPRPFRSFQYDAYVMVDEFNKPMHALAIVDADDCAVHMEWLATTLAKKYDVEESAAANAKTPYSAALEIDALGREIRIQCGPHLRFDYLDAPAIDRWRERRNAAVEAEEREQSAIDRRRLVLERRRSLRFANQFTQGNQYRLEGAFGISFEQPFAEHSSKKFPIDEPFYVALPNLPEPFAGNDLMLEISPERHPISIRGMFTDVPFDALRDALRAKYGTPSKATDRHIIHPVGANRAILKRLDQGRVELAFVDTAAQEAQRKRLWDKESEGL